MKPYQKERIIVIITGRQARPKGGVAAKKAVVESGVYQDDPKEAEFLWIDEEPEMVSDPWLWDASASFVEESRLRDNEALTIIPAATP